MKLTVATDVLKPDTMRFEIINYLDVVSKEVTVGTTQRLLADAIREHLEKDSTVKQMVKEAVAEALSKFDKEIVFEGVKAIAAKAYAPGMIMKVDR